MATKDTARKRVADLKRGVPTFDKGVVPEKDMFPSAARRALRADKTGEIQKKRK